MFPVNDVFMFECMRLVPELAILSIIFLYHNWFMFIEVHRSIPSRIQSVIHWRNEESLKNGLCHERVLSFSCLVVSGDL